MGNIAILNAIKPKLINEPLGDGLSSVQRVFQWASKLPDVEAVYILASEDDKTVLPGDPARIIRRERWGEAEFMETLISVSDGHDALFYGYTDCPLLDLALSEQIWENHRRYYAQYSFADGFPYGLAPEILNTSILTSLATLVKDESLDRKEIFSILSRDINSFDIETEISPRDLRLHRISLTVDNRRNFDLVSQVFEKWGAPGANELCKYLEEDQSILRNRPAFGEIQITNRLAQDVDYLPQYPGSVYTDHGNEFMGVKDFDEYFTKFVNLSGGDGTVNLGFRGEPSFHPEITALVERVLKEPDYKVLLETAGIGWSDDVLNELADLDRERILWIVTQDSINPEVYKTMRGSEFEVVNSCIEKLETLFSDTLWVQATRINSQEDSLEEFYRHWKDRGGRGIIQKYDWFCGELPSRKVTDLSPLTRHSCWHLKRDFPVLLDGTVLTCREDLKGDSSLGNLHNEDVFQVWKRGETLYQDHINNKYPGICEKCDEYYTFNF